MSVVWTFNKTTHLGAAQPHYAASLGGGRLVATVANDPQPGGPVLWHLTDLRPGGLGEMVATGDTETVETAMRAAEEAARTYLSKRGRKPLNGGPMTSTDRNKHRVARLLAREVEAEEATRLLVELHRDLAAAGRPEWARRVAGILRITALKAAAEYTRRNASFFVSKGPRLPSTEERAEREKQIVELAKKLDAVAEGAGDKSAGYGQFEEILGGLHKAGFFPDTALVSAVAQGYFLAA